MDKDVAKQIVKTGGWLALVPAKAADQLLANALLIHLEPGSYLFRQGDPPGGLYAVVKGTLLMEVASRTDSYRLLGIQTPGGWFGQKPSLTGSPRTISYRSVGEVVLLNIPLPALRVFMDSVPDGGAMIASISEWYLDIAIDTLSDMTIPSAERRIAAMLLRLAKYPYGISGEDGGLVELSQSQIAEVANASRDNVNRAIAKFRRNGWLESGYKWLRLTRPEAIERFVAEDEFS
ncbi:Crp/Fnr family transcriptional regulator [Parasphingopyxis sp.]|uniref:Crp/Fnr family transcriptional regulator n=1 Tax=Parasphingopyxis sp. TaxID=1920299 RepID=UPI002618B775|nr:Crp/Fnr family transcriptional regulator [Parasphingopyxis sp.]